MPDYLDIFDILPDSGEAQDIFKPTPVNPGGGGGGGGPVIVIPATVLAIDGALVGVSAGTLSVVQLA